MTADGSTALGNVNHGIQIFNASSNTIGGTTAGAGNVISGNSNNGIFLLNTGNVNNNLIQGNLIGTNAAGTAALPNGNAGIVLGGSLGALTNNTIGGTTAAARNVISGNTGVGIAIPNGADKNLV